MVPIAINARFYVHRPTGMQRYALELARRFGDRIHLLRPLHVTRASQKLHGQGRASQPPGSCNQVALFHL